MAQRKNQMIKTSANDILLYESCPHRWELSKGESKSEKKSTKQIHAFYRFSSALHFAVKKHISELESPFEVFEEYWDRYKEGYPLIYKEDETWDSLKDLGLKFLEQFRAEFPNNKIDAILTENKLVMVTEAWKYTGQPDLIGFQDSRNRYVSVEYKTTEKPIDLIWIRGSDQLTGAAMLISNEFNVTPPIDILVCNFCKETGGIHWFHDIRNQMDIDDYILKINHFVEAVNKGYHPRRSLHAFDSPCYWCEFDEECYVRSPKAEMESLENFAFQ